MVKLGINVYTKKYICERIQEVGMNAWKDGFNAIQMEKEYQYVLMERCQRTESFTDGSVGARGRLMVKG